MNDNNIWSDEWGEQGEDWSGGDGRDKRLPRGSKLGATVSELDPGNYVVYSPVRCVMASSQGGPEVVEYPDLGQITAQARTGLQTGDQLWLIYDVPPASE